MTERVPMRCWFAPVPMLAGMALTTLTNLLGRWQLTRAHECIEHQIRIMTLENAPAQRITAQPVTADSVMYKPMLPHGTFDMTHTVLLENRSHITNDVSRPGFEVLVPLILEDAGGRAVLIDRGWLPYDSADRTRIVSYTTPADRVQVEGMAVPHVNRVLSPDSRDGADGVDQRLRQSIDPDVLSHEIGVPSQPFVVQRQSDVKGGLLRGWPHTDLGAERNYGYASQWFTMAVAVFELMVLYGVRRYRRLAGASESA